MSADVVVWRIGVDTPAYEAHDLSGKGAELTGGRWNRKGMPMLYASASRALACLETIVHLEGGAALPLNRYLVQILIPAHHWRSRVVFDAPAHVGWDAEPAGRVSIDWGTHWARAARSLVAEVPSVIVPEESNVLITPAHPDAAALRTTKLRKWLYDQRLR